MMKLLKKHSIKFVKNDESHWKNATEISKRLKTFN